MCHLYRCLQFLSEAAQVTSYSLISSARIVQGWENGVGWVVKALCLQELRWKSCCLEIWACSVADFSQTFCPNASAKLQCRVRRARVRMLQKLYTLAHGLSAWDSVLSYCVFLWSCLMHMLTVASGHTWSAVICFSIARTNLCPDLTPGYGVQWAKPGTVTPLHWEVQWGTVANARLSTLWLLASQHTCTPCKLSLGFRPLVCLSRFPSRQR